MHTSAMLGVESVLHSDFPSRPEEDYDTLHRLVLSKLGLRFVMTCTHTISVHCSAFEGRRFTRLGPNIVMLAQLSHFECHFSKSCC